MANNKFPYCVRGVDIKHDGQDYVEGSVIELDDETASTLKAYLDPIGETKGAATTTSKVNAVAKVAPQQKKEKK